MSISALNKLHVPIYAEPRIYMLSSAVVADSWHLSLSEHPKNNGESYWWSTQVSKATVLSLAKKIDPVDKRMGVEAIARHIVTGNMGATELHGGKQELRIGEKQPITIKLDDSSSSSPFELLTQCWQAYLECSDNDRVTRVANEELQKKADPAQMKQLEDANKQLKKKQNDLENRVNTLQAQAARGSSGSTSSQKPSSGPVKKTKGNINLGAGGRAFTYTPSTGQKLDTDSESDDEAPPAKKIKAEVVEDDDATDDE